MDKSHRQLQQPFHGSFVHRYEIARRRVECRRAFHPLPVIGAVVSKQARRVGGRAVQPRQPPGHCAPDSDIADLPEQITRHPFEEQPIPAVLRDRTEEFRRVKRARREDIAVDLNLAQRVVEKRRLHVPRLLQQGHVLENHRHLRAVGERHVQFLDVTLTNGTQVPVIFKDMTLLEEARHVKPSFLYDPLREIEVYRDVLAPRALNTAKFLGAVTKNGRNWLFLERVTGDLLWQVGDVAIWRAVARWLARLHRTPANSPRLFRYDRAYYRQWMERATTFHPAASDLIPVYERAVERLLQLPVTFIHGEFYASNILVQG